MHLLIPDPVLICGSVAGLLAIAGLGLVRARRRHALETGAEGDLAAATALRSVDPAVAPRAAHRSGGVPASLAGSFNNWLTAFDETTEPWTAFDQFLRELLAEHLGATRVRCYHVRPGAQTLQPIAQSTKGGPPGPSAQDGLLGHVAATGREFWTRVRARWSRTLPAAALTAGPGSGRSATVARPSD
jgi:hypothetical protein